MEPFQIVILLFFAGLIHGLCRAFLDVGLEEGYEKGKKQGRTDFVFMKESAMMFGAYDMIFEPRFPEEKKKELFVGLAKSCEDSERELVNIDLKTKVAYGIEKGSSPFLYAVTS